MPVCDGGEPAAIRAVEDSQRENNTFQFHDETIFIAIKILKKPQTTEIKSNQ